MPQQVADLAQAKARSHPIRVNILRLLRPGRVASPTELAKELGLDLTLVSYHVRKLVELECLELVDTKPRRGAVEHYYRAVGPALYTDDTWAQLSDLQRDTWTAGALTAMAEDIKAAVAANTIDSRLDRHITHNPFQLDEQGWKQIAEELEAMRQRTNEIAAEAVNRIARGDTEAEPIAARLLLLFFEAAPNSASR